MNRMKIPTAEVKGRNYSKKTSETRLKKKTENNLRRRVLSK